ncbi:mitochondrial ribosomal death-associated protein 3-domain-containing protein [Biscogniauxia mediterranea]|nr:mitochondrial ribosomal death-associated protein 3-domain-containing protein [Biscogniauxia mediterranea]
MASTNCWRCLARPTYQRLLGPASIISSTTSASTTTTTATAAFSTSTTQLAVASTRSTEPGMSKHVRIGKKLILGKKKKPQEKFKSPGPGERKAFRKRIQLSNDNALEVRGLPELTPENITDPQSGGMIMKIPVAIVDQLRASEAFKASQNWKLFRSPHVLIRDETVELAKLMTEAVEKQETLRLVITGDRGSGKSIIGLQALATGFMNKWVVINIPEGNELTTGNVDYSQVPNSELYAQPSYTVKLMQALYATNPVLSQHRVQLDHLYLPISVSRGTSLATMLNTTKEPEFAWPVFQAFWKELLLPGRPPIVFSLDGLAHIMRVSDYRSPDFELIHSHDLGLVRLFADAIGGKTRFPNGAVVLGVTSKGNAPLLPSMDVALGQAAALQARREAASPEEADAIEVPQRDPFYRRYDERVFDALKGVRILDLHGLSKPEARALMEYWAASGIVRMRVDEKTVTEKWTIAGAGVVGEMERSALYDIRL